MSCCRFFWSFEINLNYIILQFIYLDVLLCVSFLLISLCMVIFPLQWQLRFPGSTFWMYSEFTFSDFISNKSLLNLEKFYFINFFLSKLSKEFASNNLKTVKSFEMHVGLYMTGCHVFWSTIVLLLRKNFWHWKSWSTWDFGLWIAYYVESLLSKLTCFLRCSLIFKFLRYFWS